MAKIALIDHFKNDHGYVPFTIIGIALVLVATLTSAYFFYTDHEIAMTIHTGQKSDPEKYVTACAALDLSRALNYAGIEAMYWQGKNPVIKPEGGPERITGNSGFEVSVGGGEIEAGDKVKISAVLPRALKYPEPLIGANKEVEIILKDSAENTIGHVNYNNPLNLFSPTFLDVFVDTSHDSMPGYGSVQLLYDRELKATTWFIVGPDPVKDIIAHRFSSLIRQNYQNDLYKVNTYSFNVNPDVRPEQIVIKKVNGTREDLESGYGDEIADKIYTLYYIIEVKDLEYILHDHKTGEDITGSFDISTTVRSRKPLLSELVSEYEASLNTGFVPDAVQGMVNLRTLTYGPWQRYGNGPLNILTNPSLAAIVNAAALHSQKRTFNSVDPWAMTYSAYFAGKVIQEDVMSNSIHSNGSGNRTSEVNDIYEQIKGDPDGILDLIEEPRLAIQNTGSTFENLNSKSKIRVSASDYISEVIDGWVFRDQQWPGSLDLTREITQEIYSVDVEAQIYREGFDEILTTDSYTSGLLESFSYGTHEIRWDASYISSGTHNGAIHPLYEWEDAESRNYASRMNPSINPPRGSVTDWRITGASVRLVSAEIDSVQVSPDYYPKEHRMIDHHRKDGFLEWEEYVLDWEIGYQVSYLIRTTWDIEYDFTYNYRWVEFEGYSDPVNMTGPMYSTHHGSGSGSDSSRVNKNDLISFTHIQSEYEDAILNFYRCSPAGEYNGIYQYQEMIENEYQKTYVNVNGEKMLDMSFSDAADIYSSKYVDMDDIHGKYWLYNDGSYLERNTVKCKVPDWLHRIMAEEITVMVNRIRSDDPGYEMSLLENRDKNPSIMQKKTANKLIESLEQERHDYISGSWSGDGKLMHTASDACRYIALNEAYGKILKDIEEKNTAIEEEFDSYIFEMTGTDNRNIWDIDSTSSNSLSIFGDPSISMISSFIQENTGIIDLINITGEPGSRYHWNENLSILVDQYPHYLYHDPDFDLKEEYIWRDELTGKVVYPLGVRNTCVFSFQFAEDLSNIIEDSTNPARSAAKDMVGQSITQINSQITYLEKTLSYEDESLDTSALNSKIDELKSIYGSAARKNIPAKISEEVCNDPVLSSKIESENVHDAVSNHLTYMSNDELIQKAADGNLSEELSVILRNKVRNNSNYEDDELEAILYRLDSDVRVGIATGISEAVLENNAAIDSLFDEIQNELECLLDDAADIANERISHEISSRLKKSLKYVPSGLPLIPSHWAFTVNMWTYDVVGKYKYFRIVDNSNKAIMHPQKGHIGQEYVRQDSVVYHPIRTDEDGYPVKLGTNEGIRFHFGGYAVTVVGPGPAGVGDRIGGRTEKSEGYDELISEIGD